MFTYMCLHACGRGKDLKKKLDCSDEICADDGTNLSKELGSIINTRFLCDR